MRAPCQPHGARLLHLGFALMLLRRIRRHLEEQNWLAVGLDLAMVVLGVFLGIQVDAWNQQRIARAEEADYLARLLSDVDDSIALTDYYIDFMTSAAERATVVLRSLERCSVAEAERVDFANGLYHLGKLAPATLSRGTIDELLSTGKLGILSDDAVREALAAMLAVHGEFAPLFSQAEGRTLPHVNYVDANVVFRIEGPARGNTILQWEEFAIDLDRVCRDRRFHSAVAAVRNYTYDVVTWNRATLEAFRTFRSVLTGED